MWLVSYHLNNTASSTLSNRLRVAKMEALLYEYKLTELPDEVKYLLWPVR